MKSNKEIPSMKIKATIAIALAIAALTGCSARIDTPETETPPVEVQTPISEPTSSAEPLLDALELNKKNSFAAETKYKNSRLYATAEILSIDNYWGSVKIRFGISQDYRITVAFDSSQNEKILELEVGQTVAFEASPSILLDGDDFPHPYFDSLVDGVIV
jgi:hypothetical protein